MTQLFKDGSDALMKSANFNNQQHIDSIAEELKHLTEPKKVRAMVNKMVVLGILTERDVNTLKEKGIKLESQTATLDIEQERLEPNVTEIVPLENKEELEL